MYVYQTLLNKYFGSKHTHTHTHRQANKSHKSNKQKTVRAKQRA